MESTQHIQANPLIFTQIRDHFRNNLQCEFQIGLGVSPNDKGYILALLDNTEKLIHATLSKDDQL